MAATPKSAKDAKIAPAPASSGAPRWTYAVGAIVGAAALLWGIVSYFIPKPEPLKPPVAAVPAPAPSVNVEGTGNIGVGTMSGGTITQGAAAGGEAAKAKK